MWEIHREGKSAKACRIMTACKNLTRPLGGVEMPATKKDVEEHRASKIGEIFTRPETMEDRLRYCKSEKCKNLIEVNGNAVELRAPPCKGAK